MSEEKKPRERGHEWWWPALVKTHGSCCLACLKPPTKDDPLVMGHIHRHADGGGVHPNNLVPLHRTCNAKSENRNGFTKADRAENWLDTFLKLLLVEMDAGLGVNTPLPHVNTPPGTQPIASKVFTNFDDFKFVRHRHYKTPTTPPTYTTELEDAKLVLNEMRRMIREYEPKRLRPKLPVDDMVDKLLLMIMRRGGAKVLLAFAYYLEEDPAPWVMNARDGLLYADSLKWFVDNFWTYHEEAVAQRKRRAADSARARLHAIEMKNQQEIEELRSAIIAALDYRRLDADWLFHEDNRERRDNLVQRVKDVTKLEQLQELSEETAALGLEIQQWVDTEPGPDDFV